MWGKIMALATRSMSAKVLSAASNEGDFWLKIAHYLRAETTVWIIDPDANLVEVYALYHAPVTLGMDDVLPDSSCPCVKSSRIDTRHNAIVNSRGRSVERPLYQHLPNPIVVHLACYSRVASVPTASQK